MRVGPRSFGQALRRCVRRGVGTPVPGTVVLLVLLAAPAAGQDWPTGTLSVLDRRVTVGGEVLVTVAPEDRGRLNATDYHRSTLRLVRLGLVSAFRANERVSFVLEVRAEGDSGEGNWTASPYAAYVSLRPVRNGPVEIQAGRIASVFGGFPRRAYGNDNLLIGYPLAYQYPTSLRQDAIPRSADELLLMRGHGAYVGYGAGQARYAPGVPIANIFRSDTGVLVRSRHRERRIEALGSLTVGSLSRPGADGNGAPQVAGRLAWRPSAGLVVGGSASRGGFLSDRVGAWLQEPAASRTHYQQAYGADIEYSRDYWLIRTELVTSRWDMPAVSLPAVPGRIGATSWLIEGRYTVAPGAYVAARLESLRFTGVRGTYTHASWDADVWRTEVGIGYALTRHVRLKVALQHGRRDGGYVRRQTLGAAQAAVWF